MSVRSEVTSIIEAHSAALCGNIGRLSMGDALDADEIAAAEAMDRILRQQK